MCEGRRAGLLLLCVQGALWSRTFPGAGRPFPLVGWSSPPSWGGQRGQGHDHSPMRRTSVLPMFTVGHVDPMYSVTMYGGNPPAPRCPGLSPAGIHRLVSWWPGDHSTCRSSSYLVRDESSASDLESLTYFIVTITPPSTCYHPNLQIRIPRD